MKLVVCFLCLYSRLGLAGDPEALFQKGRNAIEGENWAEARAYLVGSMGEVIREKDLPVAIKAVKALEDVYRNMDDLYVNAFPTAAVNGFSATVERGHLLKKRVVEEEKNEQDTVYWSKHRYFKSLLTANQLCHEASTRKEDSERLLLLAMHKKPGYLPTIIAILKHYTQQNQMTRW